MAVKQTVKEQVESLKISAQYQAVKLHVRRNKKFYVGFGTGALLVLVTRRPAINVVNTVSPSFMPVFNNTVNNGGYMRKIVRCLETGEIWLSVKEAAAAQGKNAPLMSQHLNHPEAVPVINGLHFVIEALATS